MKKQYIPFIITITLLMVSACSAETSQTIDVQETSSPLPSETPQPTATITPTITHTPTPTIETGKGRIRFQGFDSLEEAAIRKIEDDFLIGVGGATGQNGCVPTEIWNDFRRNGVSIFSILTSWTMFTDYGGPCPDKNYIEYLATTGAHMDGAATIFLYEGFFPEYLNNLNFEEQMEATEEFIFNVVSENPEIEVWVLNEPIAQSDLSMSREQNYEFFVEASKWIHTANPDAKVLINLIPIYVQWSRLYYEPHQVLSDLIDRGIEIDILGLEMYNYEEVPHDIYGYISIDWVSHQVESFKEFGYPIILTEIGIPGTINGIEQFDKQADWFEAILTYSREDPEIIGAIWWFTQDEDEFITDVGLVDDNNSLRPVGERLLSLIDEWYPVVTLSISGNNFIDLEQGLYDIIANDTVVRIFINTGDVITVHPYE